MKYLITGATGFIGRVLVSTIKNEEFRVVLRSEDQSFLEQSICDFRYSSVEANAFSGVSSVVHLAGLSHCKAESSDIQYQVNCTSTINLAKQCVEFGVKRFVFVSTILVNGSVTKGSPYSKLSLANPLTSFARSKYDAEMGLIKLAEKTGLEVVIVRPTLVYGPHAPGNFGLLTKLVKKFPVLPFGHANNKRDFIAVQNLADLLITCATHPNATGHTFLASDMETVSIKQFTNAIANGLGKKMLQLPIPVSLMRLAGKLIGKSAMVEQLVGDLQVDSSNLKEVLGWTPPYTMKQAMASLRDSGKSISGKD